MELRQEAIDLQGYSNAKLDRVTRYLGVLADKTRKLGKNFACMVEIKKLGRYYSILLLSFFCLLSPMLLHTSYLPFSPNPNNTFFLYFICDLTSDFFQVLMPFSWYFDESSLHLDCNNGWSIYAYPFLGNPKHHL